MVTRREFLDTLAVGAAGLAVGSTAKSYGQIMGSNDRLNFAVIGSMAVPTRIFRRSRRTRVLLGSRTSAMWTATF